MRLTLLPEAMQVALRARREELLKENLAQRPDLQQEWLALVASMDQTLQTIMSPVRNVLDGGAARYVPSIA